MRKAIKKVRISHVSYQVNGALNLRNNSFTGLIHDLPYNSLVLIFCKRNAS